jgi:predicted dienelactone hydrolase/ABC-type amino acid transport substrate-binding protein
MARCSIRFPGSKFLGRSLLVGAIALLGSFSVRLRPVEAAERVRVTYGLLEFPLTLVDLETFAETGEIRGSMRLYARFLDEEARVEFRRFLQQRLDIDAFTVSQVTYSPMGERTLQNLGTILRTEAGTPGFPALRAALILAADDEVEGLSMINVIRQFPSASIRISVPQLLALRDAFTEIVSYRDAAIAAIATEMEREIEAMPTLPPLPLESLTLPGPYSVATERFELRRDRLSSQGEPIERPFQVDLYLPTERPDPAPVVVVSHGLGSSPNAFSYLGEHLASHGFAVVIPQHIGSDAERRAALLEGILSSDVNPVEFIDRPLDIKFTLDTLEQRSLTDPALQGRLDLQRIGAIGHSFGGYTVLALAGAPLSLDRLHQTCAHPPISLNAAPTLQCLASRLPRFNYQLQDERIQAVVAMSPITSVLFGPEGVGQIQVPTLIMGGSDDFIAAAIQEQIHPFVWLNTPDKYLSMVIPSSHTFADNSLEAQGESPDELALLLSGPNPELGREFVRELGLAMMQVYLGDRPEYQPYLTATYAQQISQGEEIELQLVRSLTPDQLETAFGREPPVAILPALPEPAVAPSAHPILAEIAETGVLQAAMRTDAAPFGFLDDRGQPAGFCLSLLQGIADQVADQVDRPVTLEISAISTVETRYELVRSGKVQVECGPNTVRDDLSGIAFSTPFFLTGTHFLVAADEGDRLNPFSSLSGTSIGVLSGTTTERFLRDRYPNAQVIPFAGRMGRTAGVEALVNGAIDAFASDGVLLSEEANRQGIAAGYQLVPERPLTCDPYGLLLPANDPEWQRMVNFYMDTPGFRSRWEAWFTEDLYPQLLFNLDYCVS